MVAALNTLPVELCMKVLEYLPIHELCDAMPMVCWDLHGAAQDEALWRKLYMDHFHVVILSHRDDLCSEDWRSRYMGRKKMVACKGLVEFSELLKTLLRDPQSFARSDVMQMYTTVFHFCTSNYRIRDYGTNHLGVFQMLVDACVNSLDEMTGEASMISDAEELLEYYIESWDRYQNVMKRCNTIFAYFQRNYKSKQENGNDLFERMVNAFVANKNWGKNNVILGITPMMTANWVNRFFSPLQPALERAMRETQQRTETAAHQQNAQERTETQALESFSQLAQILSQYREAFPRDLRHDLLAKLGLGGEREEERGEEEGAERVEVRIEGMWLPPSAGVAVQ